MRGDFHVRFSESLRGKFPWATRPYGSDDNVQNASGDGMNLVSPVSGKEPGSVSICDFEIDEETNTVKACPAGHEPLKSEYGPEKEITRTVMPITVCSSCELRKECPVKRENSGCHFDYTAKQLRLDKRRRYEKTDAFQEKYRKRAGIEATNSGIKQRTGMSRLRVRGKPSVFNAILLKIAGWNILQAARSEKSREYVRKRVPWNSQETIAAIIEGCLRTIRGQIRSNWRFFQLREKNICWNENNQLRLAV